MEGYLEEMRGQNEEKMEQQGEEVGGKIEQNVFLRKISFTKLRKRPSMGVYLPFRQTQGGRHLKILNSQNTPRSPQTQTYLSLGISSLKMCTVSVLLDAHRKSES